MYNVVNVHMHIHVHNYIFIHYYVNLILLLIITLTDKQQYGVYIVKVCYMLVTITCYYCCMERQ